MNEETKNILFYDVSGYLSGTSDLALHQQPTDYEITFGIRSWWDSLDLENEIKVYIDGDLANTFLISKDESGNNASPYWGEYENITITYPATSTPLEVKIISDGGLSELRDPKIANVELEPGSENYQSIGTTINPYWSSSSASISFINTEAKRALNNLGQREYWFAASDCITKGDPISVLATSYENTHHPEAFSFEPPLTNRPYYPSHTYVLADFQQIGKMSLLVSELAPYAFQSDSLLKDGKIKFYSREDELSEWADVTALLLTDDTGCILARKTLIGDFNNDSKPDAFFLCTGTDYYGVTGEIDYGESGNRILLSTESGIYENRAITTDYPYTYSHGGAAFDFNHDGNLDVLATDKGLSEFINGRWIISDKRFGKPYLLLGDGQGNFVFDDSLSDKFGPSDFPDIFSLEVLDANNDGKLDIWTNESASDRETSYILYNNDGDFEDTTRSYLPIDLKYTNAMDTLLVGSDLFTIYINVDYSHEEYYWGVAIQKVNLDTLENELIYSHDGLYDNGCGKHSAGVKTSWFPWLYYENGMIGPRNTCEGIAIPISQN